MALLTVYKIGFMAELIGITKVTKATFVPAGNTTPIDDKAPSSPTGNQQTKLVMAMVINRRAIVIFCWRLDVFNSIELHLNNTHFQKKK